MHRAVQCDPSNHGTVDVPGRFLSAANRYLIDNVADQTGVDPRCRRAPRPKISHRFKLGLPALRGDKIGIACVCGIATQIGRGQKVGKVQLPDPSFHLGVQIEPGGRVPGRREETLGPDETARLPQLPRSMELRIFGPDRCLERQLGGHRPAPGNGSLIACFVHLGGSSGKRYLSKISFRSEREQCGYIVEAVERRFCRGFPCIAFRLPAILGAADGFAFASGAHKTVADRRRLIGKIGDEDGIGRIVPEGAQADQLDLSGAECRRIISADFVAVAILLGVQNPETIG